MTDAPNRDAAYAKRPSDVQASIDRARRCTCQSCRAVTVMASALARISGEARSSRRTPPERCRARPAWESLIEIERLAKEALS